MSLTIFPFPRLFGDLVMAVSELRIDGQPAPQDLIDSLRRTVQVRSLGREEWRLADIDVAIEFPVQELRVRDVNEADLSVLLQLTCNATDLRATERLSVRDGRAHGTISFLRELVADRVDVWCVLCQAGDDGIPRILRESQPWEFAIAAREETRERPPRTAGRRTLSELFDVRWRTFEDDAGLRRFANELYFVDVETPGRPTIYLNEGVDKYRSLLSDGRASSRAEEALREMEYRRVSLGAWTAAALHALEGVSKDESGDLSLPEGWRRDVLDLILGRLHPEQSIEVSASSICRRRSDGAGYGVLLGELEAAINQMLDATSVLRKHLSRVGQESAE